MSGTADELDRVLADLEAGARTTADDADNLGCTVDRILDSLEASLARVREAVAQIEQIVTEMAKP